MLCTQVMNTDAEGRLTLADSLVYACRLRVDAVCLNTKLTNSSVISRRSLDACSKALPICNVLKSLAAHTG